MNDMHHLVFGAGLTGGYLAGGLMNAGISTHMVAREQTRAAMGDGLHLSDYSGCQKSFPTPNFVNRQTDDQQKFDFIWLTVKCTSVAASIDELSAFVKPSTVILCCQNGFGSEQIIRDSFPENDVLVAIIGFNVAQPKPGHLHRSTEGKLVIQHALPNHKIDAETTMSLVERLNCDMLPAYGSDNIQAEQWAKLQLNLTNPVNALANIPLKQMLEDRGFRKIVARLMNELLVFCDAQGIILPQINVVPGRWIPKIMATPNFVFNVLGKKMIDIDPTARLSMWWDLNNGKATEIDFINGALVDAAKAIGVACTANQAVVDLIKQVEVSGTHATLTAAQINEAIDSIND